MDENYLNTKVEGYAIFVRRCSSKCTANLLVVKSKRYLYFLLYKRNEHLFRDNKNLFRGNKFFCLGKELLLAIRSFEG